MSRAHAPTRRRFLRASAIAASAAAAPYFVPARVLGAIAGVKAPSDRIGVGVIGTGGMGQGQLGWIVGQQDLIVRGVCDVDAGHRDHALNFAKQHDNGRECVAYADFRELLARDDVDAVWIVTPDHWHAVIAVAAAKAGKDIYCQKPLANSIGESRAIVDAAQRHGRVLQCGSQERSNPSVRFACELVRNGKLGEIESVHVHLPCDDPHHAEARQRQGPVATSEPPAALDYDFWLGPAEHVPYAEHRCHFWWRFNSRFGAGEMSDRGAHIIDIAQLALDMDRSGPIEYQAQGVKMAGDLYDVFLDFTFENTYPNGVRMIGHKTGPRGIRFNGSEGSLFVHIHGGKLDAAPATLLDVKLGDGDVQLGRTESHERNFIDCVRSRAQPFAGGEIGHRTATACQLNLIAMRLGRPLKWDPVAERVLDDEEANGLLMAKLTAPWSV